MKITDKTFDLNYQYSLYLERMFLDERIMPPIQKTQLKQAFMASWGMCLLQMRDELNNLEFDDQVQTLENQMNQISNYFLSLNARNN